MHKICCKFTILGRSVVSGGDRWLSVVKIPTAYGNIPTHQFSFLTFSCIKIIHLCEVKQGEVNHFWEKFIVKAKLEWYIMTLVYFYNTVKILCKILIPVLNKHSLELCSWSDMKYQEGKIKMLMPCCTLTDKQNQRLFSAHV